MDPRLGTAPRTGQTAFKWDGENGAHLLEGSADGCAILVNRISFGLFYAVLHMSILQMKM